jgi:hypothetical protein
MSLSVPEQETRRCQEDGCGVPSHLIDPETLYCFSHCPTREADRKEAHRRAGEATARRNRKRTVLDVGELGALETPADAARWCAKVGSAVAEGRLSSSQAQATIRAVSEFIRARDLHVRENKLRDLEREVALLRGNGNGGGKR